MRLEYSKEFLKGYRKLDLRGKEAVDRALVRFQEDPFWPGLRNHPLKGEFVGSRSIDAGFDLRIVLRERDNYMEVLLLQVGTHSQLYG